MQIGNKKISLSLLILILITFILPFITISCQNQEVASLNGLQLAVGKTIEEGAKIPANPFIILVLVLTIAGIVYCFKMNKINSLVVAGIGGANLVLLFIFKSSFTKGFMKETGGTLELSFKFGFWAAVLAAAANLCFHGYSHLQGNKKGTDGDGVDNDNGAKPPAGDFVNIVKSKLETGIDTISVKSKNIVETTKLNSQISTLQGERKKALEDLGTKVYEMNSKDGLQTETISNICSSIKEIEEKIEDNKRLIGEIQNKKPESTVTETGLNCSCGAKLNEKANFCNNCGAKMELALNQDND